MRCRSRFVALGLWLVLVVGVMAHAVPARAQVQLSPSAASAGGQPAPGQLQASITAATQNQAALPSGPAAPSDDASAFWRFFRDGEWYFSWGYNREFWAPTDIHVSQPSLGNNFTIYDVRGHDQAGGESGLFTGDAFGAQYNIRVGRFITDNFGVEFSLDHSKYTTPTGQFATVNGTIAGKPNGIYQLGTPFFSEELHNGANHVMIDGVYRLPLIGKTNDSWSVAAIGKAGVGVMLPHTSDTILGNSVDVGNKTIGNSFGLRNGWWQLNGVTAGVEGGFRVVLLAPVYVELTNKIAYSYLGDLPAYLGTISQSQFMDEVIVSVGFTYDGTSPSPWH
jgi:hypothetical protein